MADQVTSPRAEDLVSVGSRISWGAIFAGAILALALYFLTTILGGAVGLSISDRVNPSTLKMGAIIWAILSISVALFVGGLVTSQFTVGENKMEAVLYGIIMWAVLFGFLLYLGAQGARAGFSAMIGMANVAETATTKSWDRVAQEAGWSEKQIAEWRVKLGEDARRTVDTQDPQKQREVEEAATKITWYAFAGTWISMIAAALGAWVGAGPTFRVVAVHPSGRGML